MNKGALFAAASIAALLVGGASEPKSTSNLFSTKYASFPKKSKVLYNQNNDDAGERVISQTFTGGSSTTYSSQGADDFVVPNSQSWTIAEVDVTGMYFEGSGPPASETVIFYKNEKGYLGKPVKGGTFNGLNGGTGPDFTIPLPDKGLTLKSGTYWVSVIPNMDFLVGGAWGWEVSTKLHGKVALWRNPDDGFGTGCTNWSTLEDCLGYSPDFMFTLRGTSK